MKSIRPRHLVSFRLNARAGATVAYFEGEQGEQIKFTRMQAANDEQLPRWLVSQIGYVDGANQILEVCCPGCRSKGTEAAQRNMLEWQSPELV